MKISLIGMSGIGKTYWSKKLEKLGWMRFCIDDLIEQKLEKELKSADFNGTDDVARWMGMPFDKQYPKHSKKYLEFEKESMNEVFREISKLPKSTNIVIDSTGSVIYTGIEALQTLTQLTKIIYLNTTVTLQKEMHALYLREPKPVLWGNAFNKKRGEKNCEALARCYPELLEYRLGQYKKLSDMEIDYFEVRKPGFSVKDFLKIISSV